MRKHTVKCQIENKKNLEYIQYKTNEIIISYIKKLLEESSFTKEEKLKIIDELLNKIRK